MEYGCPVCNGLISVERQCPCCGTIMKDGGMVEDYYGPYSPYDDMDMYEQQQFWALSEKLPCVHLFACPACGFDARVGFKQMLL